MAQQTINLGTSLNAGDGDPLRTAFDKVNDNFDELYARDLGTDPENLGVSLAPATNGAKDLGTPTKQWGDLYVKDFINLNGSTITVDADGNFVFSKEVIATVKRQQDIVGSLFADDSSLAFDAQNSTFHGKFDGDLTGSVFADDSTVLVDGVNGTISAANLTGALPAIDGSALTGVSASSIAFSNVTSTPTTLAGYGITDAVTAGSDLEGNLSGSVFADDSTVLVDGVNGTLNSSALTKPIALADNEKLTFGDSNDFEIFHNSSNNNTILEDNGPGNLVIRGDNLFLQSSDQVSNYFRGVANGAVTLYYNAVAKFNTSAAGIQIEQGVEEKFDTLTSSTGTVTHDCSNGHVFYHTGATGDITANFTNLGLTAEYGTNLTVIINQGATPYEVTAVQIGGVAQTINWQGGSAPTGNANGIDSFSFTILNDGGTYVVLGQMVDFT